MKNIVIGSVCYYKEKECIVRKFMDHKMLIVEEVHSKELHAVEFSKLVFDKQPQVTQKFIDTFSDEEWTEANRRFSIIKPIIDIERGMKLEVNKTVLVKELSEKHNVGYVTIYRWLSAYNSTGMVSSLIPVKPDGGKNKSRLSREVDVLIDEVINSVYNTSQKNTKKTTATEVIRRCKNAELPVPHVNTIYSRIKLISKKKSLESRIGYLDVSSKIAPTPGTFTEPKNPLDFFQIDHTLLDIFVVTEEDRTTIGRPYITLAIDVYSRMVAGLYISLDPPGTLGTGICLSNAILPKDDICAKYELKSDWPLWGVMRNLHLDNAKEFKGKMLKRASEEYGFIINWRPKGKARYGAHIERLLGTLSKKIHALPGTTFEQIKYRSNYDSKAKATMTLSELEKWLHTQIVDIYHNELHTGIKMSPLNRYKEGIFGSDRKDGIGIPLTQFHPDKVKLDFLPIIERTIQRSGVVIDHINYYSDIFKNYMYENAWKANDRFVKNRASKSYIFKRDPRDLSKIYFLDENEARYVEIPYADMRRAPISLWEYRESLKKAKEYNPRTQITEDLIFDAHNRLKAIEENSISAKKEAKRVERKRKVLEFKNSLNLSSKKEEEKVETEEPIVERKKIEPFEFE